MAYVRPRLSYQAAKDLLVAGRSIVRGRNGTRDSFRIGDGVVREDTFHRLRSELGLEIKRRAIGLSTSYGVPSPPASI